MFCFQGLVPQIFVANSWLSVYINTCKKAKVSSIFILFLVRSCRGQRWRLCRHPLFHFCALSSEPVDGFRPNLHRYIVGKEGKRWLDLKVWWPWPYFQGHRGTLKCPKYFFCASSSKLVDRFWISYRDSIGHGNISLFKWSWWLDQDGGHAHMVKTL